MKKGIIVLLIMALVAGYAFAAFSGNASISAGVDFDAKTWGLKNATKTTYKFSFTLDSQKVSVDGHETDIWAEIAAEASATVKETNAPKTADNFALSAKVKTANIHVGDITFGILNAGDTADYAAVYHDDDEDDEADINKITAVALGQGFTVDYKGYHAGFAAAGDFDGNYTVNAAVETKSFDVAEGVTAQAAAAALTSTETMTFVANAKAGYEAEKLSANVAADVSVVAEDSAVKMGDYEVAADAAYDFVAAYAYYNNDKVLDAKVEASYDVTVSDVDVALTAYVDGRDLIQDAREVVVGATEECTIDAVTVEAYEDFAIIAKVLDAGVKVSYDFEKCTVYGKVDAEFDFEADDVVSLVKVEAGVTSKKIVENAELSLIYKNANTLTDKGNITCAATISFK